MKNINTKIADFRTKPPATPTTVRAAKEMNELQLLCSRMYASTAGGGGKICGEVKIGVVWCRRQYKHQGSLLGWGSSLRGVVYDPLPLDG